MLYPSKMQGEAKKGVKGAFWSALRAIARTGRAKSKIRQHHSVRHCTLTTHAKVHSNPKLLPTTFINDRRTEAITLREAGSAKSLSVGPSGPKKFSKVEFWW